MTQESRANVDFGFDGNTFLLFTTTAECGFPEYVYNSGYEILKFNAKDSIVDFISLMSNNMIPTTIAIGQDKNTHVFCQTIVTESKTIELKKEWW